MDQPRSSFGSFTARLWLRGFVVVVFAALVSACASSPPWLRPIDEGDALVRIVAHWDNFLTILERAKGVDEAKRELEDYCGPNREQIHEIMSDLVHELDSDDEEGSARFEALKEGIDHRRRVDAIEARPGWRGELWRTLEAVPACFGRSADDTQGGGPWPEVRPWGREERWGFFDLNGPADAPAASAAALRGPEQTCNLTHLADAPHRPCSSAPVISTGSRSGPRSAP